MIMNQYAPIDNPGKSLQIINDQYVPLKCWQLKRIWGSKDYIHRHFTSSVIQFQENKDLLPTMTIAPTLSRPASPDLNAWDDDDSLDSMESWDLTVTNTPKTQPYTAPTILPRETALAFYLQATYGNLARYHNRPAIAGQLTPTTSPDSSPELKPTVFPRPEPEKPSISMTTIRKELEEVFWYPYIPESTLEMWANIHDWHATEAKAVFAALFFNK
ncbi:hypothetical protein NADFUDRAFT_50255 [Nadsonia fulvescens var. elongata DSM 6958]|uniref:Uncharacterized protein n=1 Tax=Nadsonia fulvescens var. elongata DSM 6958 TaxID=857566 RepID=A0A1E3PLY0_9ASCO|nr:hypothetical protein NADFUDRAFT_50255 [Nadsonia fulvescens var. elongata DSM 6958]